jgi:hypothetical protein
MSKEQQAYLQKLNETYDDLSKETTYLNKVGILMLIGFIILAIL